VSHQTLYAYVSRGFIQTALDPQDSRKRQYSITDVDHLVHRQQRGRSRQAVAKSTIYFGEPSLKSTVSRIDDGQFYYRDQNAVELSNTATLEEVFELLCFANIQNYRKPSKQAFVSKLPSPFARLVEALARQTAQDTRYGNKRYAYHLLKLMALNAAPCSEAHSSNPTTLPIHEQLGLAWSQEQTGVDLIRRALVLCADHELNASTYATRVCASAGSSLPACLLAGISTLSGRHHGGLTNSCLAWMRTISKQKANLKAITSNTQPPGFGHKLYPHGDPRALELLRHCSAPPEWAHAVAQVLDKTSLHPTLDYGLATLEHQLKLPKGAGFAIFALGRTVGWLAHCFEQRKEGRLIRPRAEA